MNEGNQSDTQSAPPMAETGGNDAATKILEGLVDHEKFATFIRHVYDYVREYPKYLQNLEDSALQEKMNQRLMTIIQLFNEMVGVGHNEMVRQQMAATFLEGISNLIDSEEGVQSLDKLVTDIERNNRSSAKQMLKQMFKKMTAPQPTEQATA